ncbi:hypothetical protein CHH83_02165 [Bacillus sp. 7586-K]|nr:hypothetical protein CHH83_02165 [Bacillus sp. 7586-K]
MRRWMNFYTFLVMVVILITTYSTYIAFKHPYVGANVSIKEGHVYIEEIEPLTWASENLKVGYEILSINGHDPLLHQPVKNWNIIEQLDNLTVVDEKNEVKTLTLSEEFQGINTIFHSIIPLILVVLCIFCSYFIYKSYRNAENSRESAILLMIFLFSVCMAYVGGGASSRGDYLARYIVITFFLMTPVTYLHFLYTYFKELGVIWFNKNIIWICYILIGINNLCLLFRRELNIDGLANKSINLVTFIIFIVLVGILIFIGHRKANYKSQKYMIRVLMLSNIFSLFPFVFFYVIPYTFTGVQVFSPAYLAGFLIIIPFALVYQFLATKIYDIEFFVGRLKYYSIISLPPAIVGLLLIITIKTDNPNIYSVRVFIFLYILMVAAFYFKETFDFKFKFNRFSEKHNYHNSLMKYTEKLRSADNTDEVVSELKENMTKYLLVNSICLVQLNKYTEEIILSEDSVAISYQDEIVKSLSNVGTIIEIDKGFVLNIGETNGVKFVVVALSPLNTPKLTRDEKEWLKSLAYYTNVTLESFNKIESLVKHLEELQSNEDNKPEWLSKMLVKLEEKQRSELAKDLHDLVLQDLIGIKITIENLYTRSKDMKMKEIDKEVYDIVDNISNTIDVTRKTCNELRPQFLYDLGIDQALKRLPRDYAIDGCVIKVTTSNLFSDIIDEDVQLNIYRISQELLNNARKHSNAKNIKLIVVRIKEKIVLHYEDDGKGANIYEFSKEGSIGISGIKERVRLLGGTINIETEPNKGFKVVIEM